MNGNPILEVCAGSPRSLSAAYEAGARRVELCSALNEGGVTPSAGLVKEAVGLDGLRVHCLIRPRGGDFFYDNAEAAAMIEDVAYMRRSHVDGIVIGALTSQGDVDVALCRRLIEEAGDMSVTFHRAFDMCRDPFEALETIIDLGCSRILTSGQAQSAMEGLTLIGELSAAAAGRIIIMPGGGVNASNIRHILESTGTFEIHASASVLCKSAMQWHRADVNMGAKGADEYSCRETDAETVRDLLRAIENIPRCRAIHS